jgi:OmpA-OmpF porin, OOP family
LSVEKLLFYFRRPAQSRKKAGKGIGLSAVATSHTFHFGLQQCLHPWPIARAYLCVLIILFLSCSQISFSQNLVPNPGFEEYFLCPGSYNYSTNGKLAPGWFSPTRGTPDLFNVCSKGDAGVPSNWAGLSKAYSGVGYAGLYCYALTGYREYLQTELIAPMVAGGSYYIEFYFKLSSNSKYSIDRIGLYLSDSANWRTDDFVIFSKPTYELVMASAYTRATGTWIKCSYRLVAKGGERYLTIGNFSANDNTKTRKLTFSKAKESMLDRAAYFFIDDVRVERTDGVQPEKPIVIAGYPEIKTNETYVLKNIFFEFDRYELIGISFEELDKWIVAIKSRPSWQIELTGHTDERGTDEYNLKLSKQRVQRVTDYLISKGIAADRFTLFGEGKRRPLSLGKDEAAHALNRRVEIKFTLR